MIELPQRLEKLQTDLNSACKNMDAQAVETVLDQCCSYEAVSMVVAVYIMAPKDIRTTVLLWVTEICAHRAMENHPEERQQ